MRTLKSPKQKHDEDRYHVKLPAFEGPFDLLFHLVNKEEVDIWDISLSRITEQYLKYLHSLQELNTDRAGDFLVMAASLLHLKSRMLLPQAPSLLQEREEEALFFGSKEELVRRLLEYNLYKSMAVQLKKREEKQKKIFLRLPETRRIYFINKQLNFCGYDLSLLQHALLNIGKKKNKNKFKQIRIRLPEGISFTKKIQHIITRLKRNTACLYYYLEDFLLKREKREVILTFSALLELAKRGSISLRQKKNTDRIQVLKKI